MFFKTISTVALLATAVVAKPIDTTTLDVLAPLDLPTVQTVFTAVQEKIDKMVAQVKEFTGDTKQMEPILAASLISWPLSTMEQERFPAARPWELPMLLESWDQSEPWHQKSTKLSRP